eukprot:g12975.t1
MLPVLVLTLASLLLRSTAATIPTNPPCTCPRRCRECTPGCGSCGPWYGSEAATHCEPGYYGAICENRCSSNCKNFCARNGRCLGYEQLASTDAATHCLPGFYGADCNSPCYATCANGCARDNYCVGYHLAYNLDTSAHCQRGFSGLFCTSRCPTNCASGTCVTLCAWCTQYDLYQCSGYAALASTDPATHCTPGFYGPACNNPCVGNCTSGCARDGNCAVELSTQLRQWQMRHVSRYCILQPESMFWVCRAASTDAATHCINGFCGRDCAASCTGGCAKYCSRDSLCAGYQQAQGKDDSPHCFEGYGGDGCSLACPPNCAQSRCHVVYERNFVSRVCAGYKTSSEDGKATYCTDGFWGSDCAQPCSATCANGCTRSGLCVGYNLNSARETSAQCQRGSSGCVTGDGYNNFIQCSGYAALAWTDAATHCAPGFHGSDCSAACSETCANGCAKNGACVGHHLKSVLETSDHCQKGYSGLSCQYQCPTQCASGTCVTSNENRDLYLCSGYTALASTDAAAHCTAGFCGRACSSACSKTCARGCTRDGFCLGYHLESAQETSSHCQRGFYGYSCDFKCPANCANGTCVTSINSRDDSKTCSGYAAIIYTAAATHCTPGFSGVDCSRACGESCATGCTRDGFCVGYHLGSGLETSAHCRKGYSGNSCLYKCPANCANGTCVTSTDWRGNNFNANTCSGYAAIVSTAAATHCTPGFSGVDCSSACGESCAAGCTRDGFCVGYHLESGLQTSAHCRKGYSGNSCLYKCPANCVNGTCVTLGTNVNANTCSGYAAVVYTAAATHCTPGFSGFDCSSACAESCAAGCTRDGLCVGYHLESGLQTSAHCRKGYSGNSCSYKCPANCMNGTCVTLGTNVNANTCSGYAAVVYTAAATHCTPGFLALTAQELALKVVQQAAPATDSVWGTIWGQGYSGNSCLYKCPANCANGTCVTSTDSRGTNFNANTCSGYAAVVSTAAATHCTPGFSGFDCSSACGESCAAGCTRDGLCVGYHLESGLQTSAHCRKGYSGNSCSYKCPANCMNGTCVTLGTNVNANTCSGYAAVVYTAAATHCTPGFFGVDCSSACAESCAAGCTRDGFCVGYHLGSGLETSAHCRKGYSGNSCLYKCPANCVNDTCVTSSDSLGTNFNANTCSGYAAVVYTAAATHCIPGFNAGDCSFPCSQTCARGCTRDRNACAGFLTSGGTPVSSAARETSDHCQKGYSGYLCQFECPGNCASGTCVTSTSRDVNMKACSGVAALASTDPSTPCIPGFYGDGCNYACPKNCALFQQCTKEGKCVGHHIESNRETSAHCKKGYFGKACEFQCPLHCARGTCVTSPNGNSQKKCSGRAALADTDGAFHCVTGLYGDACAFECPTSCSRLYCAVSGNCVGFHRATDDDSSPHCLRGYYGNSCEFLCPINCAQGTCGASRVGSGFSPLLCSGFKKLTDADPATNCKQGFYGATCGFVCPTHCARPGCTSTNGYCLGHAVFNSPLTPACHCENGFYGISCENACPAPCPKCSGNGGCLPAETLQQCACCQSTELEPCGRNTVRKNAIGRAFRSFAGTVWLTVRVRNATGKTPMVIRVENMARWGACCATPGANLTCFRAVLSAEALIPGALGFTISLLHGLWDLIENDEVEGLLAVPFQFMNDRMIQNLEYLAALTLLPVGVLAYIISTGIGIAYNAIAAHLQKTQCIDKCRAEFGARRQLVDDDDVYPEAARYTDGSIQAMELEFQAQKFFAQLFGDECWLALDDKDWIESFVLATASNSSEGSYISSAELQSLTERLPKCRPPFQNITNTQVFRLVQRQNNAILYKEKGRKCPSFKNCADLDELAQSMAEIKGQYRHFSTQFPTQALLDWQLDFLRTYSTEVAEAADNGCVPWCRSRNQQCGYDGCGGTCGSCPDPLVCNGSTCAQRMCAGIRNMKPEVWNSTQEGVKVVVENYQSNLNCSWLLSPSNKSLDCYGRAAKRIALPERRERSVLCDNGRCQLST